MKYTDEEIKNKFSNVNFDETGWKKQAVFNKIVAKQAGRRFNMRKRYLKLTAAASLVVLIAVFGTPIFKDYIKHGQNETYSGGDICQGQSCALSPEEKPAKQAQEAQTTAADNAVYKEEENFEAEVLLADSAPMPAPVKAAGPILRGAYAAAPAVMRSKNMAVSYSAPLGYQLERRTRAQEQNFAKETKDYTENAFKKASLEPLSTFSADVDTASYSMLKEQINRGWGVQKEAVRIESLINNFDYNYAAPKGAEPLSVDIEYSDSPWNKNNKLVKIGVKAKTLPKENRPQDRKSVV